MYLSKNNKINGGLEMRKIGFLACTVMLFLGLRNTAYAGPNY
jgi:hypothetical protein